MTELTPSMMQNASDRAHFVLRTIRQLVAAVFGDDYKVTVVLCYEGKPDSLAILSDIEDKDLMLEILACAADKARLDKMHDPSTPKTAH